MTLSLDPKTDAERAIHGAFAVLIGDRENLSFSLEQLLPICRAAPTYTLNMIARHRTSLMQASGSLRGDIAYLVRGVEWELLGASEFIEYHHLGNTEDTEFIFERLTHHPQEFSRDDLLALLNHFTHSEHPIRQAALEALRTYVISFGERLTDEPLGLSGDIQSLQESIRDYGFSPDLNAILEKIDEELGQNADAFDQVATMRHIRSFFEKLHESVGKELQAGKSKVGNGTPLGKCGQAIDYLERKSVTTPKIKELGRCLYAILSDGDYGVHALKADRDYTRLCRNMVVEYSVTLMFELERRLAQSGDS